MAYTPVTGFTFTASDYTPSAEVNYATTASLTAAIGAALQKTVAAVCGTDSELVGTGLHPTASALLQRHQTTAVTAGADLTRATPRVSAAALVKRAELPQMVFSHRRTLAIRDVIPPALVKFTEAFDADTGQFTKHTEGTQADFAIADGQLTLTNSGGSACSDIITLGSSIVMPQVAVSIDVVSRSGLPTSYDNLGVGLAKDANNFVFATIDRKNSTAQIQVKASGATVFRGGIPYTTPAAPFTLAMSLCGTSVCLWAKTTGVFEFVTGYDVGADINFRTATISGWKPGLIVATSNNSTWTVDNFTAGSFGAVGMRDPVLVTLEDGTPYTESGKVLFTATGNDGLGYSTMGLFDMDVETYDITQRAVYMFDRDGTKYSDVDGHIIYYPDGRRLFSISTWGNGFGNLIEILTATFTDEILAGEWLLSGFTQMALPYIQPGWVSYAPRHWKDGDKWRIAYNVCENYSFSGHPFYVVTAESDDFQTWSAAGQDRTFRYEGPNIVKMGSEYFITVGTSNIVRCYDKHMARIGDLKARFDGGTETQPHAVVFENGAKWTLVTFNNQKPSGISAAWTWGEIVVHDSPPVTDAYSDPLAGDPGHDAVVLQLHGDGDDDGTTFLDASRHAQTVTPYGGVVTKTAGSKFGSASMYFDGSGDYLLSSSADYTLGGGNFTVSFWVSPIAGGHGSAYARLVQIGPNTTTGSLVVCCNASENPTTIWTAWYNGSAYVSLGASSQTLSNDVWHHVALTRRSDEFLLFIDGALASTVTTTGVYLSGTTLAIGGNTAGGENYYGYLDEVQVLKGTHRYDAAYPVPTSAFQDVAAFAPHLQPDACLQAALALTSGLDAGIITAAPALEASGDAHVSSHSSLSCGSGAQVSTLNRLGTLASDAELVPQPAAAGLSLSPTACLQKTMYKGRFIAPTASVKLAGSFSELTLTAQTYLSAPGQATTSLDARVSVRGIYTTRLGAHLSEQPTVTAAAESSIALAKSGSTVVAAQLQKERTKAAQSNAWLQNQPELTADLDADLGWEVQSTASIAAQLQREVAKSAQTNARVSARPELTAELGGILGERPFEVLTATTLVAKPRTRTPRANAWVTAHRLPNAGSDARLGEELTRAADASAALQKADSKTAATSAYIYLGRSATAELDSYVAERHTHSAASNALKARVGLKTPRAHAYLSEAILQIADLDARLGITLKTTLDANGCVQGHATLGCTTGGFLVTLRADYTEVDAQVAQRQTATLVSASVLAKMKSRTPRANAWLRRTSRPTAGSDADLAKRVAANPTVSSCLQGTLAATLGAQALLSGSKATTSNALLRRAAATLSGSNSLVQAAAAKTLNGSVLLTDNAACAAGADACIRPRLYR